MPPSDPCGLTVLYHPYVFTLLLLHGEPTWSYLFRQQIPIWAARNRVIAVDHMGFGKSAAPQDRTYWLQDHIDNLERFVLELDLRDLTLVMHDFGGPVGMGLAIRHPNRIKRIVSVEGPTPAGQPDLMERLSANVAVSPLSVVPSSLARFNA
jgi:haloalkane dehalogenase